MQAARPQRGLPRRRFKYCKVLSKLQTGVFTVVECARSKFISESYESKLNSDSSDGKEMILNQNSDVLVPNYIETINFDFHFLEQIQRAD